MAIARIVRHPPIRRRYSFRISQFPKPSPSLFFRTFLAFGMSNPPRPPKTVYHSRNVAGKARVIGEASQRKRHWRYFKAPREVLDIYLTTMAIESPILRHPCQCLIARRTRIGSQLWFQDVFLTAIAIIFSMPRHPGQRVMTKWTWMRGRSRSHKRLS